MRRSYIASQSSTPPVLRSCTLGSWGPGAIGQIGPASRSARLTRSAWSYVVSPYHRTWYPPRSTVGVYRCDRNHEIVVTLKLDGPAPPPPQAVGGRGGQTLHPHPTTRSRRTAHARSKKAATRRRPPRLTRSTSWQAQLEGLEEIHLDEPDVEDDEMEDDEDNGRGPHQADRRAAGRRRRRPSG